MSQLKTPERRTVLSLRLNDSERAMLDRLRQHHQLPDRSAVIRLALIRLARAAKLAA